MSIINRKKLDTKIIKIICRINPPTNCTKKNFSCKQKNK